MNIYKALRIGNAIVESMIDKQYLNALINLRTHLNTYKSLLFQQNGASSATQLISARQNIETQLEIIIPNLNNYRKRVEASLSTIDHPELDSILGSLNNLLRELRTTIPSKTPPNIALARPITDLAEQALLSYFDIYNLSVSAKRFELDNTDLQDTTSTNTLSITYKDELLTTKLKDLPAIIKEWTLIINCFARLVQETDTDIEIVSIKQGSLIITLAVIPPIIAAVCKCSDQILGSILKLMEVKQKVAELKQSKFFSELEIANMEKKVSLNINEQASEITDELLKEYLPDESNKDYHEIKTAVLKAVKRLIRFEGKGVELTPFC